MPAMNDTTVSLLNNPVEVFQVLPLDPRTYLVISALDTLSLNDLERAVDKDKGAALVAGFAMNVYAETVVLAGTHRWSRGILSAEFLAPGTAAELSVAGAPGENGSAAKVDGSNGGDGQALCVYLGGATNSVSAVTLNARGGDGGDGQRVSFKARGGNGGSGGNGGEVTLLTSVTPAVYLGQLCGAYALSTLVARQRAVQATLNTMTGDPDLAAAWPGVMSQLNAAIKATADEASKSALQVAILQLQMFGNRLCSEACVTVSVAGGAPGCYGPGSPNGASGQRGDSGKKRIFVIGDPSDLARKGEPATKAELATFEPGFFFVHPSQCARLLERLRLQYFMLDPVHNPTGVSDLLKLLVRLHRRTQPFVEATDDAALVTFYNTNQQSHGAVDAVGQLRSINADVGVLLDRLRSGLDCYGYEPTYVPLGSFPFYSRMLHEMIADLGVIEATYKQYFQSLETRSSTKQQLDGAQTQAEKIAQQASSEMEMLKKSLPLTAQTIAHYDFTLPPLKRAVKKAFDDCSAAVEGHLDFNIDTILQHLTCIAFAPQSKFMALTQAASFVYDTAAKITDDAGAVIQKGYLVSQIQTIGDSIESVDEGYGRLESGKLALADPGQGILVAETQSYLQLMDRYRNLFGGELAAVKTALDAFIAAVAARNNQVLTYNVQVQLYIDCQETLRSTRERAESLDAKRLTEADLQLPDVTSFMSSMYYRTRGLVMMCLDLTARAYRFWALSDRRLVTETYRAGGKLPSEINHASLCAAEAVINDACAHAIEAFGSDCQVFPYTADQPGVVIDASDGQLAVLRETGLLVMRPATITPGVPGAFSGMANVRISAVRVWVDGVSTGDGKLSMSITHCGAEEIVSADGIAHPFVHEPVTKLFSYTLKDKKVFEDATFGAKPRDATTAFAPVGPFAFWHIQLSEVLNRDLKLDDIKAVRVEFSGTNDAFFGD